MPSAVTVGQIGPFGLSVDQAVAQIWQMLLDSRTGAFPFKTATSASGSANDGVFVPFVSTFGNGVEEYVLQIWQMLYDARTGQVPFVVST